MGRLAWGIDRLDRLDRLYIININIYIYKIDFTD